MEKKKLIISTYYAKLKRDANIIYLLQKATISIRHHRKTLENHFDDVFDPVKRSQAPPGKTQRMAE